MRARDDCPFFTFLTDSPDNENVPISGVVPNLQNEDHLKKGESCKGGETYIHIYIHTLFDKAGLLRNGSNC